MPHHPYITAPLLLVGVLLCIACTLAMAIMRDPYQRLQYLSPITSVAVFLIVICVWIEDADWQARIKSLLVAIVLFVLNATLSHATARAVYIQRTGHLNADTGSTKTALASKADS